MCNNKPDALFHIDHLDYVVVTLEKTFATGPYGDRREKPMVTEYCCPKPPNGRSWIMIV